VKAALTNAGCAMPKPDPYPPPLRAYLHRHVEMKPMKTALAFLERTGESLFIKPADRWKSFTGFVTEDSADIRFNGASRNQNVWVGEVVEFVSEWRVYVLEGIVRHPAFYHGAVNARVSAEVVEAAVAQYVAAGAPAGFAIDFGVLKSGETTLIEPTMAFPSARMLTWTRSRTR
jgi:hypothetical protein